MINLKKHLKYCIQGWLPEELSISSHQQTSSHKAPIAGVRFGILLLILGFAGGFLGVLDAALGLGLFSGVGLYVSVILLVVCIAIAAITAISRYNKKRSAKI